MNFEHLPVYTLLSMLVIVLVWELFRPRRPEAKNIGWRWANNLALTVIDQLTAKALQTGLLLLAVWYARHFETGLLAEPAIPWLLAFVVNFLVLDAIGYGMHRAFHKVPALWRIHQVHHADTEVDFSTTYRHHPFEVLIMQAATVPVIVVLAPPVTAVLAQELIRTVINVVAHGNIHVPERVNRVLLWFMVTPDFHRLHHSSDRRFTDSNYGATLPWFDYLFKTASHKPFAEQATMQLGLEYARAPEDSRVDRLLLMPFADQRALRQEPLS